MSDILLRLSGLTKAYPGVVANKDVSFDIRAGEIHALLGENGAGKSTLVKTIFGLVRPDTGEMILADQPFTPSRPSEARAAGVGMVFQHFSLFDALNVAENVALGMEHPPAMGDLAAQIREVSDDYGLPLDPGRIVGDLSAGERQRVEIIRCLLQDPRLLIMDEPTSVLTPQEVDILFETLRNHAVRGRRSCISRTKLEEIRSLCEHATILRLGEVVGTCDPRETSARDMAEMMVGSALHVPERAPGENGDVLFEIKGLNAPSPRPFGTALRDVSVSVRKGEVLGIGGVAGNGQDELLLALSGEMKVAAGMITLRGAGVGHLGPTERRALGLLCAPEERIGHAAAPDMSLTEKRVADRIYAQDIDIEQIYQVGYGAGLCRGGHQDIRRAHAGDGDGGAALSGGNLQKFVIGREILQQPDVLVVNQPTWGVDASAAAAIRQALLDLAGEGAAVIVVSQDLDELMEISDRFAALNGGKLSPPRPTKGLTVEEIGLMLGGAHDMEVAHVAH